jgi:hypothetical protein
MPPTKYSVHPGVIMAQQWEATLEERTGRSLSQWMALLRKQGPATPTEQRAWLKDQYGLGANAAGWIVDRAHGKGELSSPEKYLAEAETYVEAMFGGAKAALRPIYDTLLDACVALGPDIRICPASTIVPVYRRHVIAQIKPSTRTRVDFGLALGDTAAGGPLVDTGGYAKKDRITHRIAVTSVKDVNADLRRWLKRAYDRDQE